MKGHTLTLFHMATDILASRGAAKLDCHDIEVDADTLRHDVYDEASGRLVLSANIYPHNRAIKEILFPHLWLN